MAINRYIVDLDEQACITPGTMDKYDGYRVLCGIRGVVNVTLAEPMPYARDHAVRAIEQLMASLHREYLAKNGGPITRLSAETAVLRVRTLCEDVFLGDYIAPKDLMKLLNDVLAEVRGGG